MTRTERSAFPRAVNRDRSLSKSGLERSIRKDGGGAHNWGRLEDEIDHEYGALEDDIQEDGEISSTSSDAVEKPTILSPTSSMTEEELEAAKQFRKHAFKKVDLASIARTSNAVSTSPPKASVISDTSSNISA